MILNAQKWISEKDERGKITLLHGMGGTGAMWRPIAANLEAEFSVLAPDQRGHGKSRPSFNHFSPNQNFGPLAFGQDVIDTLEAQHFYPTFLIGHSMGVRSAIAAAYLKSEWVTGLILIDLGFSGAAGGGMGDELAQFMKILPTGFTSRSEARDFLVQNCPDASIAQYLLAVSILKDGQVIFPFDPSDMIQIIEAAKTSSAREWLKELGLKKMPILVLRGKNSKVFDADLFEEEKKTFKDFSSIQFETMPGVGHGLPFENRSGFVDRVKQFCSG